MLDGAGSAGVIAIAVATAVLAYLMGATYVGAEWSTRSMVALLFWEPRRDRVMAVKLAVLAAATALLGDRRRERLAHRRAGARRRSWIGRSRIVGGFRRGVAALFAGAGRGVMLVVLIGLLGFGVANLLRNTGGALGFGFLYFVIIENLVGALRPAWQEWLVTSNAIALLAPGGNTLYVTGLRRRPRRLPVRRDRSRREQPAWRPRPHRGDHGRCRGRRGPVRPPRPRLTAPRT